MPRVKTVEVRPVVGPTTMRDVHPAASRSALLTGLGYVGAGIVTVGGLVMIVDSSIGLGTRALVGALIMIAMRSTVRPTAASHAVRAAATSPQHRNPRHSTRGDQS
jgi:hypothetical protein